MFTGLSFSKVFTTILCSSMVLLVHCTSECVKSLTVSFFEILIQNYVLFGMEFWPSLKAYCYFSTYLEVGSLKLSLQFLLPLTFFTWFDRSNTLHVRWWWLGCLAWRTMEHFITDCLTRACHPLLGTSLGPCSQNFWFFSPTTQNPQPL